MIMPFPAASSLLDPDIFLSTLFWKGVGIA
jgi:hypothetical protein